MTSTEDPTATCEHETCSQGGQRGIQGHPGDTEPTRPSLPVGTSTLLWFQSQPLLSAWDSGSSCPPDPPRTTHAAQLHISSLTHLQLSVQASRQELAPPPTLCLSWMPPFKPFLQPPHLQSNQPFASLWVVSPPLSPGKP